MQEAVLPPPVHNPASPCFPGLCLGARGSTSVTHDATHLDGPANCRVGRAKLNAPGRRLLAADQKTFSSHSQGSW